MSNTGLNAVKQVVSGRIIRADQGVLKCKLVSRPMTFKDQATKTEQSTPVVAPVINAIFKRS